MNETIEITVPHFFNHPIYFPFMSQSIYDILEDAYEHKKEKALVPREEFEFMIEQYFNTLWN